jgi:hypothetical protein
MVTPVPIPNTEVKPRWADDTARATVWERRSSPGFTLRKAALSNQSGLFVFAGAALCSVKKVSLSCRFTKSESIKGKRPKIA